MITNRHFQSTRILLLGLLAASTFAACDSTQRDTRQAAEPGVTDRLQAALDQSVALGLPGAALSIRGEAFGFDGVAGVEDTATAVPLTTSHRFYAASLGKTLTAVAALRMTVDGLLGLDDPLTRWLPEAVTDRIPFSSAITLRSLLNHTSGLFDFHNDNEEWNTDFLFGDPSRRWENADILPYIVDRPLHFAPSTAYRYSDSNYVLAALVLEAAGGLSIQDIIRYYVIEPFGLQATVHGAEASGLPGFVHGYVEYEGQVLDVYPLYSHYGLSDGGIQSSAADLATFVHAALVNGSVLTEAMRETLLTPSGAGTPPSTVALGIAVDRGPEPEYVRYFNSGKDVGARADFHHLEFGGQHLTVALCASASLGDYDIQYENLLRSVFAILADADLAPDVQI